MKKLVSLFISVFVCICALCVPAFGVQTHSLGVSFIDGETPLENAVFKLYYIGEENNGEIIPNSDFSQYQVLFSIKSAEEQQNLALTLQAYVLRDKKEPTLTAATNSYGFADFGAQQSGVYLLCSDKYVSETDTYFVESVILCLNENSEETLVIIPKFEKTANSTEELFTYKAFKVWIKDDKVSRPKEIKIELLKDGELFDSVTLDRSNNWRYEWKNLSPLYEWSVLEVEVPGEYEVLVSRSSTVFVLTNTYNSDKTIIDSTTEPEETTSLSDDPTLPDETTTLPEITTLPDETTTEEDDIPKTGALKWPIPYIALAGVFVLITGFAKYKKSQLTDEE